MPRTISPARLAAALAAATAATAHAQSADTVVVDLSGITFNASNTAASRDSLGNPAPGSATFLNPADRYVYDIAGDVTLTALFSILYAGPIEGLFTNFNADPGLLAGQLLPPDFLLQDQRDITLQGQTATVAASLDVTPAGVVEAGVSLDVPPALAPFIVLQIDAASLLVEVACPADFNADRAADATDLTDFVSALGTDSLTDRNDDAIQDFADLALFQRDLNAGCSD